MSGRSLSMYKDTSASHEYLCTLIKNRHEFCKLLTKRTQIVVNKTTFKNQMLEAQKIAIKVYANQDDSISVIKTLIKHVFLLNFIMNY